MKTFILSVSKQFLKGHPRENTPTFFKDKILNNSKIHTIRSNFEYWHDIYLKVYSQTAFLSLRQWESIPYKSKSIEFKRLYKYGVECLNKINGKWYVSHSKMETDPMILAKNDGLSLFDFNGWFPFPEYRNLIILHFTEFRYSNYFESGTLVNINELSNNDPANDINPYVHKPLNTNYIETENTQVLNTDNNQLRLNFQFYEDIPIKTKNSKSNHCQL